MNKNLFKYIGAVAGAIGGFLYWNNYSCENGCAITSKWWATMLLFSFIGYQLIDFVLPIFRKNPS